MTAAKSLALWSERASRFRHNWLSKRKGDPRRAYWLARYKHAKAMVAKRKAQIAAASNPVAYPVPAVVQDSWGYHQPVHDGIDLICPEGSALLAICDAEVIDVRASGWWGKGAPANQALKARGDGIVQIRCTVDAGPFKRGLVFAYGHAEHANVRVGDHVKAGQKIAEAGFANAGHTHFMVHSQALGKRGVGDRDPKPFLDYARKAGR